MADDNCLPEGKPYLFSQKMMRATMLANLVYPVYTQKKYIRHFSPGKWWDSLYTWDAGFITLGLDEINPDLAVESLNAYTTPVGSQSAFIFMVRPCRCRPSRFLICGTRRSRRNCCDIFIRD